MTPSSPSDSTLALHLDAATSKVIDVNDGIDRLMGDKTLYVRMLARFRADYQPCVASIRAALAAQDLPLAHRIAHTLKGASGMIGAHPLHWQACCVERAIRTRSGTQGKEVDTLEPILDEVLRALDRMLAGPPAMEPTTSPAPRSRDELAGVLARLTAMLENGDGAALDLIESDAAGLTQALGATVMHRVMMAIQEFDFEAALAALGQAA